MSLTPAQIELLPPEQKAQVIALQTQMVRPCTALVLPHVTTFPSACLRPPERPADAPQLCFVCRDSKGSSSDAAFCCVLGSAGESSRSAQ